MTASAGIEVIDACKAIDGLTVLDRVSFTASPGRVTALLGPNGAGKSSLLRAVLGVDHLDAGQALIGGRPLREHRRPLEVAGGLLDADAAHPRRSARGHLQVVAASNGLARSSVPWALELVGLAELAELAVGQMSLGMRQRLGLATALLGRPAAVLLDEPHNGLDAAAIRWMRALLRGLAEAGRSVLISSHLMGEIEAVADDVVVLHQGRVVAASSLPELLAGASLEQRYLDLVDER
ncbi:MAG: transporter [Frankiales bacterium]|nr:transporter [Frankiales bacterium]